MKEFNLSETLDKTDREEGLAYYKEKDVKEFIKRLKEGFVYKEDGAEQWYTKENIIDDIDKLAGKDLQ